LLDFLKWFRAAFFMIIVFLLLLGRNIDLALLEPFLLFMYKSASEAVLVTGLLFLALSLFIRKPWCSYVCPSGQLVETVRVWPGINAVNNGGFTLKIQEVVSLLLAVVVVILLTGPGHLNEKAKNRPKTSSAPARENPVMANIFQRKSVREYTGKPAGREQLVDLVKAGMAAPTARNRQPWQFVVVVEKEPLAKLAAGLPYAKMLASAGAAIVVCGDLDIARAGETEDLWMQDCSAATQNILLAAESMGLGAVWTAAYPYEDRMKAVVDVLNLPQHIVPLNVIPVGYPVGNEKPKDKWKPERLHWNSFGRVTE
jgi:nitroreductase